MLPPALTMMASLLPGTDKLAVSITLEMTPDANVISHSFSQSIIHSCAQLHYAHAQVCFCCYIIINTEAVAYLQGRGYMSYPFRPKTKFCTQYNMYIIII